LRGERYVSLTTFHESGGAEATPVWFAVAAGRIYIFTHAKAGIARRIARNAQVTLAPCVRAGMVIGPTLVGAARLVTDSAEGRRARRSLHAAYGGVWRWRSFICQLARLTGDGKPLCIAIDLLGE
jgi:PPOX class probable F420-dependent enzyme